MAEGQRKAEKNLGILPKPVRAALALLMSDIEAGGPVRGDWPNYGKLVGNRHHCHLKKGKPTYVTVWEESAAGIRVVEVIYAGTHEKHPIDTTTLTFVGPDDKVREARKAMRILGFSETGKTCAFENAPIPWRESQHYNQAEQLPGILLSGARCREGLTQQELSGRTGIQRRHISEMENGKRPIGKVNARKLADALKIDPIRLLTL